MTSYIVWSRRRPILLKSHISSFFVVNRRLSFLENPKRRKSSLVVISSHYSSRTTSLVKLGLEWRVITNDAIRRRKNMTNIIRRLSTFDKWLNLTSLFFFIKFRHMTKSSYDVKFAWRYQYYDMNIDMLSLVCRVLKEEDSKPISWARLLKTLAPMLSSHCSTHLCRILYE